MKRLGCDGAGAGAGDFPENQLGASLKPDIDDLELWMREVTSPRTNSGPH